MLRFRLTVTALVSLLATALLALAVAHGSSPYRFEDRALDWLGPPSAIAAWANLVEFLGAPAIAAALIASVTLGCLRKAFFRVLVYAALAAAALLTSEHLAKPLVQRTYDAELTFPSGSVTAVSATALAMWLALRPVLGKRASKVALFLGVAWALLMSLAVVGAHWHTPLDCVGAILLSVAIVTSGAAVFENAEARRFSTPAGSARAARR